MQCPKCNFVQPDGGTDCKSCGIIFEKFLANQAPAAPIVTIPVEKKSFGLNAMAGLACIVIAIGYMTLSNSGSAKNSAGKLGSAADSNLELSASARASYERAQAAIRRNDMEGTVKHFTEAIAAQPDFLEAYYNRGAAKSRIAIQQMREGKVRASVASIHEAADDKRYSRDLMNQNKWYVYLSDAQQTKVRTDVEAALSDMDKVLGDEPSLIAALKLWAGV